MSGNPSIIKALAYCATNLDSDTFTQATNHYGYLIAENTLFLYSQPGEQPTQAEKQVYNSFITQLNSWLLEERPTNLWHIKTTYFLKKGYSSSPLNEIVNEMQQGEGARPRFR